MWLKYLFQILLTRRVILSIRQGAKWLKHILAFKKNKAGFKPKIDTLLDEGFCKTSPK